MFRAGDIRRNVLQSQIYKALYGDAMFASI